jgi:hypothetical protein
MPSIDEVLDSFKQATLRDIEAEASPKINPEIHDLNFVTVA